MRKTSAQGLACLLALVFIRSVIENPVLRILILALFVLLIWLLFPEKTKLKELDAEREIVSEVRRKRSKSGSR